MAREVIADKGIWAAKKRYMLNVSHDREGVHVCKNLNLKIMGIEAVKSSTPEVCRGIELERLLNYHHGLKMRETLQKFIADFKERVFSH